MPWTDWHERNWEERYIRLGSKRMGEIERIERGWRVMACWIVADDDHACFVDSVTEVAFGPLFDSRESATEFWEWLGHDPRKHTSDELCDLKAKWQDERRAA